MKRYNFHNSLLAALSGVGIIAAVLTSCVDAEDPYNPDTKNEGRMGTLSIGSLGREGDFIVVEPGADTKADGTAVPDVATFRVAVLDGKGENVVRNNLTGLDYKWDTYAEIEGELVTILSGKYKLEAASLPEEPLAGWDTPYYYGIKDFTIRIAELTKVDLVCKLANVKVTVEWDEEFLNRVDYPQVEVYFDDTDPATLQYKRRNLIWSPTETRAGYFKVPDDAKLYVRVTGIRKEDGVALGEGAGQTEIISNVAATQWHKIKIGYQQAGSLAASVKVDYTTIDSEHTIEIPDGDQVIDGGPNNENWDSEPGTEPGDEPGTEPGGDDQSVLDIVGANFNGETFDITQQLTVSVADQNQIDVRFDASKGIDQLYVTIESDALAALLPGLGLKNGEPFDIANPPAASEKPEEVSEEMWWVNMFADATIGILDPDVPIKGKTTHTFSVGGLMELLGSVADPAGNGPAVHKFGLKMVDAAGAVKEATLSIYLTE